jgi:hypothetical protein
MYGGVMRTTITLTPEAAALVAKAMADQAATFKQVVNQAIITALAPAPARPPTIATYPMGGRASLDRALTLAGQLEDEDLTSKRDHGK